MADRLILAFDTASEHIALAVGSPLSIDLQQPTAPPPPTSTSLLADPPPPAAPLTRPAPPPGLQPPTSPSLLADPPPTSPPPAQPPSPAPPPGIRLLAADDQPAFRQANVRLMPAIDQLFASRRLDKRDIACIVCGLGPGSFTGVRIGVATAKGIARGLGRPLYGVSTLDAVAWGAWARGVRGRIGVLADAMRKELYPARFELGDNGVQRIDPHTVMKAEMARDKWTTAAEPLLVLGDGLKKYAELFAPANSANTDDAPHRTTSTYSTHDAAPRRTPSTYHADGLFTIADPSLWAPTGEGLLLAFADAWRTGAQGSGEAGALLPIYTRLSDAEENERRRLADGGAIAQGALLSVPRSGVADPEQLESVRYRPMAASDVEQVAALEQLAFAAGSATGGERWSQASFAEELSLGQRSWWVACLGNLLLGFAGAMVVDGVLQVLDVAVASTHRRRGIARALVQRLMSDGQNLGATSAMLEVRESNAAAQELYRGLGFELSGRRPGYYAASSVEAGVGSGAGARREAALVMTRMLTEDFSEPQAVRTSIDDYNTDIFTNENNTKAAAGAGAGVIAHPRILAIETSCDETAAAVLDGDGRLLADVIASQVDFHARFGGVVPEIASRKHTEAIVGVVDAALERSGLSGWQQLDALAVTYAPGLIGALVVGVAFAKGLSWATGLPLVRVNHLEGHIYANRLSDAVGMAATAGVDASVSVAVGATATAATVGADTAPALALDKDGLQPPFVIALLSGGHTMLVHVKAWGSYQVLGQTLDDAVGEAFDKVAKALGLGYPGGPVISRLAQQGNPQAIDFPRAMLHSQDYSFSLSGLKTAVISYIRQQLDAGQELSVADVAASFEQAVIDVQVAKAVTALEATDCRTFCMGGGVAANKALRKAYADAMQGRGIRVIFPPPSACTDNAAMIALVALNRYNNKQFMSLDDDAHAQSDIEQDY